jgi:peroxiredoxin
MAPLGTEAPDFHLPATNGKLVSLADFEGAPALLVAFLSNHCPFVKHLRRQLASFVKDYQPRGLAAVGINANDVERYPADSPEAMVREVEQIGYSFPYVFDESQDVARAYGAACTPDFFLYDGERRLAYRGQFDGSRPGNGMPVTGDDLRAAVEAVLAGDRPNDEQVPSIGCNIKWKPGNEPDYFG